MKAAEPGTIFTLWRNDQLFNIDFASYTLSNHNFPRHFHDHFVIELVLKGADRFYCNGNTYTAHDDQLVLINPGEVHTGSTIPGVALEYFSFYPDNKALEEVAEAVELNIPGGFTFQQVLAGKSMLTQKFKSLFESFRYKDELLRQQELFMDCMYDLLKQPGHTDNLSATKKDNRVLLLIDFIRLHFRETITLQQMAGLVRLNPFHLVRIFKKAIGLSPYEYLLVTRMEYAKQLLRKGCKVQDAALDAGFYDASHFNRMFCKIAATSPKSFRLPKGQYRTILNSQ